MATDDPTGKPYDVVKQEETVGRLPDGNFGRVVRVVFRTRAGDVMSVEVPATDYTADKVKAAIGERVAHADEIANL